MTRHGPVKTALRIATRSSALALWQANHVADLLRAAGVGQVELVEVSTTGDQNRVDPLASMGGVGVFTKEVQRAVLDGRADLAVHSLKDLPTAPVPGLTLAAVPERAAPWDVLVAPAGSDRKSPDDLPDGAVLGTGSPRRRSQLLRRRPDLRFAECRGNVDTRLAKLDAGEVHALVLAEAGLARLGHEDRITARLDILPAVGQGALGIECRSDDPDTASAVGPLNDPTARPAVDAERAALHRLGAGCHAPVGVRAEIAGEELTLRCRLLSLDGTEQIERSAAGTTADAASVGVAVAEALLDAGAGPLLASS